MAYYAALASLLKLLDEIHLYPHDHHPNLFLAKLPIIKSLRKKFILLEQSLKEYSSKGEKANDILEGRIRDVAYRALDIIEFGVPDHADAERNSPRPLAHVAENIFHKLPSAFQAALHWHPQGGYEDYVHLRMVKKEINSIVKEVKMIKKSQRNEGILLDYDFSDIGKPQNTSVAKISMVGFDEYLIKIKGQLCGQGSQLHVVSIVGTGGIGKTTLARNTFDDSLIMHHFDYRAWITVSQNYNEIKVLQGILQSMGVMKSEFLGKEGEALKVYIYKYLKGRRYFVIIDDVWSTQIWDALKCIFPNDFNGSRVMLTTRSLEVAQYADTKDFVHQLQFLNDEESWNLFYEKVFAQDHGCSSELRDIGKSLVKQCGGLPLAIIVLAGILSKIKTPTEWKKIARNVSATLSKSEELFSTMLSLSYNNLPHRLKACFLYMGSFPEDYEINISKLTWMWIAEGFIKSVEGSKTLENIAEECRRSF